MSNSNETSAIQGKFFLEVGGEVALDCLLVVEHVAVDSCGTEEKDVRVIGHDAIDQIEADELGALGFGFHGGCNVGEAEQVLVPVVRDMNRKLAEGSQVNITNYFQGGVGAGGFAPRARPQGGSKRLEKAMRILHERAVEAAGGAEHDDKDGVEGEVEGTGGTAKQMKPMSMRERAAMQAMEKEKEKDSDGEENEEDEEEELEETKQKKGRKRKAPAKRGRARKRGTKT